MPSGLVGLMGAPYARNSVDLVVTGIDHSRDIPERILPAFPVLFIHICGLRLHFLVWTLSTVITFNCTRYRDVGRKGNGIRELRQRAKFEG
jgi:hypothetical protein